MRTSPPLAAKLLLGAPLGSKLRPASGTAR
jgi:hypothetical protein